MKSDIAYGIKSICYSGLEDAADVISNILDDHHINQSLQNLVFFWENQGWLFKYFYN